MAYSINQYKQNIKQRSDVTGMLTHLTKGSELYGNPTDILVKILNDRLLIGSSKGYIVGGNKVVCFQDIPLYSVAQNAINHIEEYEKGQTTKLRYYPCGLAFSKVNLAQLVDTFDAPIPNTGARPVIYEKTNIAKEFLPTSEAWRIVNFDMTQAYSGNSIIDWTHEREWRILGDLTFRYSDVTILLRNSEQYREFISKISPEILRELSGIICLEYLMY
ncbi:hypothetical protein [Sporosarcina koreensis]|uniref:hypothetical protein n=1 Tax=Sporosarcina koreensis TaxID=334735 RepID=UPI00058D1551|nr:hypothetical protein [Sporosarcina koreensis]